MTSQGDIILDMAEQVLREAGKPMYTRELAEAIRERVAAGLKVTPKNVYGYLWDAPTRFKNLGRGKFTLAE